MARWSLQHFYTQILLAKKKLPTSALSQVLFRVATSGFRHSVIYLLRASCGQGCSISVEGTQWLLLADLFSAIGQCKSKAVAEVAWTADLPDFTGWSGKHHPGRKCTHVGTRAWRNLLGVKCQESWCIWHALREPQSSVGILEGFPYYWIRDFSLQAVKLREVTSRFPIKSSPSWEAVSSVSWPASSTVTLILNSGF